MYLTIVKIIETPLKTIEEAFKEYVSDETEIDNFEIQLSPNNKYSFDSATVCSDNIKFTFCK